MIHLLQTDLQQRQRPRPLHDLPGSALLRAIAIIGLAVVVGCKHQATDVAMVASGINERFGYSFQERDDLLELSVPPGVDLADDLTVDEAVMLALWNNKEFHVRLTELGLGRANIIQARQLRNPDFSMLFPTDPNAWEMVAELPMETFILMPKRIRVARHEFEQISQAMIQNGLDLIRDVRLAYAELDLMNQKVRLTRESAGLHQQKTRIQSARLEAGEISELEQTSAGVVELTVRETLHRLERDAKVAREKLRTLIGLAFSDSPIRLAASPDLSVIDWDLDELVQTALTNRPAYKKAMAARDAAGERIGLSKLEIISISGVAEIERESDDGEAVNTYTPGFSLTVPLFHQNQAGRKRAKVEFERTFKQFALVRDQISLEVKSAFVAARQSGGTVVAWSNRIIPQLNDNVTMAEDAYAAGDLSPLVPLDHRMALNAGELRLAEAKTDLEKAKAELEWSVGARLESMPLPLMSQLTTP